MEGKYLFDEIVRLGYKCNEKCLFCNFTPLNEPGYKEKSFEDVKKELDFLIKKYNGAGNLAIYFSGGEPFLWGNDLFKMIEYATKIGIGKIGIQSNATLITEKYAFKLKDLGVYNVLVSLHSHIDSVNDKITLYKKSSSLALKGIKNLSKAGVKFTINHVLNKINYKDFSAYILFLKSIGVTKLSLGIVQPHGYAQKNFDDIVVNYDDLLKYLKDGYRIALENSIIIMGHYCDIPLCKFEEKIIDDLNYKSLLEVRIKGIRNYKGFVDELTGSKTKTKNCRFCKYNNYCYGVWHNYIKGFGEASIKPKQDYVSFFKYLSLNNNLDLNEYKYEIEEKNITFIDSTKLDTGRIKNSLKKGYLVIQYYIKGSNFCSRDKSFLINIIKLGVNVININLLDTKSLDLSLLLKNFNEVVKFSNNNLPYYDIVFFIKLNNNNLKNLLNLKFKNKIIFF